MNKRLAIAGSGTLLLLSACGGGGGSTSSGGGGGGSGANSMTIEVASNGFGKLLPHQIFKADAQGQSTTQIVEITSGPVGGGKAAYIRDPNGILIELYQPAG